MISRGLPTRFARGLSETWRRGSHQRPAFRAPRFNAVCSRNISSHRGRATSTSYTSDSRMGSALVIFKEFGCVCCPHLPCCVLASSLWTTRILRLPWYSFRRRQRYRPSSLSTNPSETSLISRSGGSVQPEVLWRISHIRPGESPSLMSQEEEACISPYTTRYMTHSLCRRKSWEAFRGISEVKLSRRAQKLKKQSACLWARPWTHRLRSQPSGSNW